MNHAALLLVLVSSSGQIDGSAPDDGYTYRIGEVNPYNDNAWHRYYRGAQSGSPANRQVDEIQARQAQSRADDAYVRAKMQEYDEGLKRWSELNAEYKREYREYDRAYSRWVASLDKLSDAFEPSGRKKEFAEWYDELNELKEELQSLRKDLNRFIRGINDYNRGASRNTQAIQKLLDEAKGDAPDGNAQESPPNLARTRWGRFEGEPFKNSETLWLDANGTFEAGSTRGHVSENVWGTWMQTGDQVHFVNQYGYRLQTYTVRGDLLVAGKNKLIRKY